MKDLFIKALHRLPVKHPRLLWGRISPEGFGDPVSWEKKARLLSKDAERRQLKHGLEEQISHLEFWKQELGSAETAVRLSEVATEKLLGFFEEHSPGRLILSQGCSVAAALAENCELRGDDAFEIHGTPSLYLVETWNRRWFEQHSSQLRLELSAPAKDSTAESWGKFLGR